MSRIQTAAVQAEWDHVREYGRGPRHARDRWCVSTLHRNGDLDGAQHGAVLRLAKLVERSMGQGGAGGLERIDRAGADPHARLFDAAVCGLTAECALQSVGTRLSGPSASIRIAALHAALQTPHLTVAEACETIGFSRHSHAGFARHLRVALDLLAIFFDDADAEAAAHAKKSA